MHVAQHYGYSLQYTLRKVPWNVLLLGMADAPGYDSSSKDEKEKEVKGSPAELRQKILERQKNK
ncbi:hypothetical protein [Peijinzhouia sedimentorum]